MIHFILATSDILVAAISSAATVLAAIVVGWFSVRKVKAEAMQAKLEMAFARAALDFGQFVEEWDGTHQEVLSLLRETGVDRFLLLRAWNGSESPRWTTAVLQMRLEGQIPVSYVHFELDQDYVARLRELSIRNTVYFRADQLPEDSAISQIYRSEGITGAVWSMIDRREGPCGSAAVTYCSFATHAEAGLSDTDITRCRILSGRLKGICGAFYGPSTPDR